MINPILKKTRYIIFYLLMWILISGIHFFILFYSYKEELGNVALLDSLVYNLIFSIIGFLLWYPVRFNDNEKKSPINIIGFHVITAIITISVWVYSGDLILKNILEEQYEYLQFLDESIVWRSAIGIFYFSIYILFYYSYIYYSNLQEKILQETELKGLVRDAELSMLKSQINPHFLFNSLNSISSLTLNKPDQAREMIVKLSDFFRYSLGKSDKELTSLNSELKNIELYLDIEKIRFGERLNYIKKVNKDCEDLLIPNMILQPLFENAVKHGVYESTDSITISLKCSIDDGNLVLKLVNGFDPGAVSKKGKGLGLRNIRRRLILIYNINNLLQTNSNNDSFDVLLTIPQISDEIIE